MFNLNPNGITTKQALLALVGNGVKAAADAPKTLKKKQGEATLKARMGIVSELNDTQKLIADMVARGVSGDELTMALEYEAVLKDKLLH